ncbi:BTG-domain-containing protein [Neoconidiobolus thromboides FSU 785]|nr:BTG-domain-containing protein [Neoconidiobolus thromboides FSU 785]
MEFEILQAFDCILRFISPGINLTPAQIQLWRQIFLDTLYHKYQNHWTPENPYQGNGFRSLTVFNGEVDPILLNTAEKAGINLDQLSVALPREFVVWVDPYSVSYKVGDNASIVAHWEDYSRGKLAQIIKQRHENSVKVVLKTPEGINSD